MEELLKSLLPYIRTIFGAVTTNTVEFLGSGFLLRKSTEIFLCTAAHVSDRFRASYPLFIDGIDGGLVPLVGLINSSPTSKPCIRDDDIIDLSIVTLDRSIHHRLNAVPMIELNNVDFGKECNYDRGFLALGYPINMNKKAIDRKLITPYPYAFHALEASNDTYQNIRVAKDTHIILKFNKRRVYSNEQVMRTAPDLNGLSGAPIWGLNREKEPKVVGVLIEHHKGSLNVVIGTRLKFDFKNI